MEKEAPANVHILAEICSRPIHLNGNYQNIIDLIDVDANENLNLDSPLAKNGGEGAHEVLNSQRCELAFGGLFPINGTVPFLCNYTEIHPNGNLHCLPIVYNTSFTTTNMEDSDLSSRENKRNVPPFLRRNRKPKLESIQIKPEPMEVEHVNDEDVIFVKQWTVPTEQSTIESNEASGSTEIANTPTFSLPVRTNIKRRRRRRTFGEKRKNPVRKAQIEKASVDLAEKLAIPPSVFNARVKRRKTAQKTITETKNLRQSCRTTGALLSPPRTLTRQDYKEWPQDGMHERPLYDETTNTIIKYHLPNIPMNEEDYRISRRQVICEMPPPRAEKSCKGDSSCVGKGHNDKKKQSCATVKFSSFAKVALDRLEMMIGYFQEVGEFNKLVQEDSRKTKDSELPECKNEVSSAKLKTSFANSRESEEENIDKVQTMLYDTCMIYILADQVTDKDVSDILKNHSQKSDN